MAAPILNDVNAHKVAGIFAKPLTEREAPGYKDLIYRPQDLKSIRAAVARGSRAANAAIEEMEAKADEGNAAASPAAKPATPSGSVLVKKTDELMPPKAIVNSAQLEMEFMRVFANAVMFNPLPPSERGLPPELDLQKDGPSRYSREKEQNDDGDDGEKKGYAQEEEGGIIHDTREMFESVEKAVAQWRSVEQGQGQAQGFVDEGPRSSLGIGVGLMGASVGMSDAVAEESAQEDGDAGGGGGSGVGMARKRRKLLE
jgi:Bromodomain